MFRSSSNIVIAPASTGRASSSSTAVTRTDHTNNGVRCSVISGFRMFIIVVIKFTAPRIEDAPAKCNLKIAKSTLPAGWYSTPLRGG